MLLLLLQVLLLLLQQGRAKQSKPQGVGHGCSQGLAAGCALSAPGCLPVVHTQGIETVVRFLRRRGVPRQQMAKLLRSYPIDYCLKLRVQGSEV